MKKSLIILLVALSAFAQTSHAALTANDYIAQGRAALAKRDVMAATLNFSNAVVQAPTNAEANVFWGVTRILAQPFQSAGSNFLTKIGLSKTGRNLNNWTATIATNSKGDISVPAINAKEATALLHDTLLPDWLGAETNLAKIKDPRFTLVLTAQETGSHDVTIDYGDIQLMIAFLKAGEFAIYTTHSWNLDAQVASVINVATNSGLSDVLTKFPKLLTCADSSDFPAAKTALQTAVAAYINASAFIRARAVDDTRLFNWDSSMADKETGFRQTLIEITNSLSGPAQLSQGTRQTFINAGQFFQATNTLRSFLPTLGKQGFVLGTFTNFTFGGIAPNLTKNEVENTLMNVVPPLLRAPGVTMSEICAFPVDSIVCPSYGAINNASSKLIQTSDGSIYIASPSGGTSHEGIISKVSSSGAFSTIYTFDNESDIGSNPSGLAEGNDHKLYGTTTWGYNSDDNYTYGTFYSLDPSTKKATVLYTFEEQHGGFIKGKDGHFYGMVGNSFLQITSGGEASYLGTVDINPGSQSAFSDLCQDENGVFFGSITKGEWINAYVNVTTVFQIETTGNTSVLCSFDGYADGVIPGSNGSLYALAADLQGYCSLIVYDKQNNVVNSYAISDSLAGDNYPPQFPEGLTADGNGNLLGVTAQGGGSGRGMVFLINPNMIPASTDETSYEMSVAPIVWFDKDSGMDPGTALIRGKDGSFYGVTSARGSKGNGNLYKLAITSLPRIVEQPQSFIEGLGGSGNLSVEAIGNSLQYQWYRDSIKLADATNSTLSLANLASSDAGQYWAVVKNSSGSATSDVAVVTVGQPPSLPNLQTNVGVVIGQSAVISVTPSGNGPFTYQWLYKGNPIDKLGEISTIAGLGPDMNGGVWGFAGDGGPALQAVLHYPEAITTDAQGNIFFNDRLNYCVRKIDTNGIISTIAGNGESITSGDGGLATNASFRWLDGIAVDSSENVYVTDNGAISVDNVWSYFGYVRQIATNGTISTVAGNGTSDWSGDGSFALEAGMTPETIAADASGNLYICDTIHFKVVRMAPNGVITTVAGTGQFGYEGDGGQATNALLGVPAGLALDAQGNIYIADSDYHLVRKVDASGIITTVAGSGEFGIDGDGGLATNAALGSLIGLATDAQGNLYIADSFDNASPGYTLSRVRKVDANGILTTVAGGGSDSAVTYIGPATNADLYMIGGITIDAQNHLLITSENNGFTIRKVALSDGNATADAGTLSLSSVSSNDLGSYQVVVTSPWGSVTSSVIHLVEAQLPVITTSPKDQRVAVSNSVSFAVAVTETTPLTYQWAKDGKTLTNSARISGATSAVLTINSAALTDAGTYSVAIVNAFGSTNASATLTVYVPDTKPPTVKITYPASNIRYSNSVITVLGTATDNVQVESVAGTIAVKNGTASAWTTNALDMESAPKGSNWSANVSLTPGSNVLSFYAQDTSGNKSTIQTVVITYIQVASLTVITNGRGTTSLTNGQKLVIGNTYTNKAKPAAGYLFSNWLGSASSASSNVVFTMQTDTTLTANFVPTPFPSLAGTYSGLAIDPNGIATNSAGFFSATIKTNGAYTAKLIQNSRSYSYAGSLALDQTAATNPAKNPALFIRVLSNDGGMVAGTVTSNGAWSSDIVAYRNPYSAKSPTPLTGTITAAIPGADPDAPSGYGSLAINIAKNGTLTASGKTADGNAFSQGSALNQNGAWPLYAPIKNGGIIIGWQSISTNKTPSGQITWIKPTNTVLHLAGFTYTTEEQIGGAYTNKAPFLSLTNGSLIFTGGTLDADLTNAVKLTGAAVTDVTKTNKLKFTLTPGTGLFRGSFVDPESKKTSAFNGVLLQQQSIGLGSFGTNLSTGSVELKK
jgi:sugar lactone lactonase YvrE